MAEDDTPSYTGNQRAAEVAQKFAAEFPEPERMSGEEIKQKLQGYCDLGVFDYLLPRSDLEEFVLGITQSDGTPTIAKMTADQAVGFLLGADLVSMCIAKRTGIRV